MLMGRSIAKSLLGLVLLMSVVPSAEAIPPAVSDGERAALSQIAEYVADGDPSRVDASLAKVGFDSALTNQFVDWGNYSAVRKVQVAYASAEEAASGGGTRFLAMLSKSLSMEYQTIDSDPALKFDGIDTTTAIHYSFPTRPVAAGASLTAETRAAIRAIAAYASGSGSISIEHVLEWMNLPETEIYDILWRHRDTELALTDGMSRVPEAKRTQVIKDIEKKISRRYHYVPHVSDGTFPPKKGPGPRSGSPPDIDPRPGHDPNGPLWPPRGGGNGGGDPSTGSGGSGLGGGWGGSVAHERGGGGPRPSSGGGAAASARYRSLISERSARGLGNSFRGMTRGSMRFRFGGVVFGNDVKPLNPAGKFSFVVDEAGVRVISSGGESFALSSADASTACLAAHVAKQRQYAMAGLANHDGLKFDVLLHPALVDSQIGMDMILVDALPIVMCTAHSQPAWVDQEESAAANLERRSYEISRQRVMELGSALDAGTWQVVDAEMEVTLKAGQALVTSTNPSTPFVFIELRPVDDSDEDKYDAEFATKFRAEFAHVATVFPSFARANEFARLLGAARWVAENGGTIVSPDNCHAEYVSSPGQIRVSMSAIVPAGDDEDRRARLDSIVEDPAFGGLAERLDECKSTETRCGQARCRLAQISAECDGRADALDCAIAYEEAVADDLQQQSTALAAAIVVQLPSFTMASISALVLWLLGRRERSSRWRGFIGVVAMIVAVVDALLFPAIYILLDLRLSWLLLGATVAPVLLVCTLVFQVARRLRRRSA